MLSVELGEAENVSPFFIAFLDGVSYYYSKKISRSDMTTKTVSVHDVQKEFSDLLNLVSEGYEVIIMSDEKPIARLVPISSNKPRVSGLNKGDVWMSEDFDTPLSNDFWTGST